MSDHILVWFRSDLRITDNRALHAACKETAGGVLGVFLIATKQWGEHDWGPPKVDFVLRSLASLSAELEKLNIPLLVRTADRFDDAPDQLLDVMRCYGCARLYYNEEYEYNERWRDERVAKRLTADGRSVRAFTDQVVLAPGDVMTKDGAWYSVFTPFKKRWIDRYRERGGEPVRTRPKRLPSMLATSDPVPRQLPGFEISSAIADRWPAGERFARERMNDFAISRLGHYKEQRDSPGSNGTSSLSPYLSVGAISPRQCLHAALEANRNRLDSGEEGAQMWISELIWREFYKHILVGFPRVSMSRPFKPETDALPWSHDESVFRAWCGGRTGFPIVDAAMRQLNQTGWMHNRLRMIVAMFLSKDLFLDWRWGERYFMQRLVDGDLAANNGGWQWSASTGTDAAPYFRIYNPTTQSERHDPDGAFIRAFLPELAGIEGSAIHDPGRLPPLQRARIDYPEPICDHAAARERVVAAFKSLAEKRTALER